MSATSARCYDTPAAIQAGTGTDPQEATPAVAPAEVRALLAERYAPKAPRSGSAEDDTAVQRALHADQKGRW